MISHIIHVYIRYVAHLSFWLWQMMMNIPYMDCLGLGFGGNSWAPSKVDISPFADNVKSLPHRVVRPSASSDGEYRNNVGWKKTLCQRTWSEKVKLGICDNYAYIHHRCTSVMDMREAFHDISIEQKLGVSRRSNSQATMCSLVQEFFHVH